MRPVVTLSSRFAGRLPRISVDPQRIEQVLGNIVDNALRHTAAGGSVHVAAGTDATAVTITVEDTGEGIAAEHLGHLFERFYRADGARDREHGGAGIGLAIAKAITEAHGGTITAASAGAGRGATFTVRLPLRAPMRSQ